MDDSIYSVLGFGMFVFTTFVYAALFYIGLLIWDSAAYYWAWVLATAALGHFWIGWLQ